MNIPLAAAALYRQTFEFKDGRAVATVFPLFDGQGKVHKLAVVIEETATIAVVNWRPNLAKKPLFRALKLDCSLTSLDDIGPEEAWQLSGWWHFDPWWLLTEEQLMDHPATPALKSTNAVNELEGVPSLHFARDLSRVTWMSVQGPEGVVLRDFDPARLPPRSETAGPRAVRGGWRLRPFWER